MMVTQAQPKPAYSMSIIEMSSSKRMADLLGVLRGLRKVADGVQKTQCQAINTFFQNSSLSNMQVAVSDKIQMKVSRRIEQTASTAEVKYPGKAQANLDQLDRLIPNELKLPPVTEADLQELAKDIESLGYVSAESKKTLTADSTPAASHSPLQASAQAASNGETECHPVKQASDVEMDATLDVQEDPFLNDQFNHKLSSKSKETKVPSNRLSRIISFGGLAASLGMGTVAEATRRSLGLNKSSTDSMANSVINSSPLFSEANMERIVSTLCRVRGAALKLGQMLSIQDNSLLNPQLQAAFERVRQSADFMPLHQLEKTMKAQLGQNWRSNFREFDDKPFAAASIGQVHRALLDGGEHVAVKVQYPGVAKSIESDINNLMSILKVWQVLPKGMYAENLMDVSKHELAWECDYKREARSMLVFKELLKDDPVFVVPQVYPELSTEQVLVTELIPGVPLDKCLHLSQQTRNEIGENLLRLCLTELYCWNIMQTDPNWSNFFYNDTNKKLYLLDFGATRMYSRAFVDVYIDIIKAAAVQDKPTILEKSKQLGFLTGYETKAMVNAHIDAVSVLGAPCGYDGVYDFGRQDITHRIENIVPVMMKHRLGPPPEETYSLHRKLSGAFLLCTKLQSAFNVKKLYDPIFSSYEYGLADRSYQLDS